MTERGYAFYLSKIVRIVTVAAFFYMLYVICACWDFVRESSELVAVQWCRNDQSRFHYADELSRHGLYVYLEKSSGKIRVREMSIALASPFQPYRYRYQTIGYESNIQTAREKWGAIKCLEHNKALIGTSGYVFSWGA